MAERIIIDYAPPENEPTSSKLWAGAALCVAVFGLPLTVLLAVLLQQLVVMSACSIGAIVLVFVCKNRAARTNWVALIAVFIVVLWASLFILDAFICELQDIFGPWPAQLGR